MPRIAFFSAIFYVVGCSSGAAIVTDGPGPATVNWSSIRVVTDMPEGAKEITKLTASSGRGPSIAIEKIRKRASKVGANTVVLTSQWSEPDIPGPDDVGPRRSKIWVVSGVAVIVDRSRKARSMTSKP